MRPPALRAMRLRGIRPDGGQVPTLLGAAAKDGLRRVHRLFTVTVEPSP